MPFPTLWAATVPPQHHQGEGGQKRSAGDGAVLLVSVLSLNNFSRAAARAGKGAACRAVEALLALHLPTSQHGVKNV